MQTASEAAAIEAKAEAAGQKELQESIRAVRNRLQKEALEDIHLSADGRTIIWNVRWAATATAISNPAKEVLGNRSRRSRRLKRSTGC